MINRIHLEMIKLYRGDPKRIQHFCKVHSYAKLIAETERVDEGDVFVIEIDVCEEKYGDCNGKLQEQEGPALAEELLTKIEITKGVIRRVKYLIAHHHTYDNIDGIDYQILVEADFLVNFLEDNVPKENIRKVYETIFKTETGKQMCEEMFLQ